VTKAFENYRFDQAASSLYQFIWHEYCDWYIELAKPYLQQENHPDAPATRQTLMESFEVIQRLLHPVMPFITEEIWQSFPHEGRSIMTQLFPAENPEWANAEAEQAFSILQSFVNTVRTSRALLNISASQTPTIYGKSTHEKDITTFLPLRPYIESILRSSVITDTLILPLRTLQLPSGHFTTIGIPVPNEIDLQQVVKKIQKQIVEKEMEAQRLANRLSSPDFKEKAEPSIIQESEDRRTKLVDELYILSITEQQLASMTA
jgi:valyl-tRNA synthetase